MGVSGSKGQKGGHVHETMPPHLQRWLLGSEWVGAHPEVDGQLNAQKGENTPKRRPPPPLESAAPPPTHFLMHKDAWFIQPLGHLPTVLANPGVRAIVRTPPSEDSLRSYLTAASSPLLPALDGSLCPMDARETRRCACTPGGELLELASALAVLQRAAEQMRKAESTDAEVASAESAAASSLAAPLPADANSQQKLRLRYS
ncbi:hypothetical protein T492DRAFT_834617 [Pavlovales sp. CCMP2436]|nr:hypothetical protein T492DRAFT_834617 [Pavlovales sp. CCMP2436]